MSLISNIKNKLASKHSFKKNELADMGPGKKPGRKKKNVK